MARNENEYVTLTLKTVLPMAGIPAFINENPDIELLSIEPGSQFIGRSYTAKAPPTFAVTKPKRAPYGSKTKHGKKMIYKRQKKAPASGTTTAAMLELFAAAPQHDFTSSDITKFLSKHGSQSSVSTAIHNLNRAYGNPVRKNLEGKTWRLNPTYKVERAVAESAN